MPEDSTKDVRPSSPIERARAEVTAARQLAGDEKRDPLTWEDRKEIVVKLSKALRTLNEIERTYQPKEVQG